MNSGQKIMGCEKIGYNGAKIPAPLFKIIPKDSFLRKYPLDQLVDGFTQEMDLESELTVEQLTEKHQRSYDNLLEMFKKHKTLKLDKGNRLVPADSSE